MITGEGSASSGTSMTQSDEPVVSLTRAELKVLVSELMVEVVREMRPDSALVREVGGKPTVEAKCYANGVEEAMTRAVAAYNTGKTSVSGGK